MKKLALIGIVLAALAVFAVQGCGGGGGGSSVSWIIIDNALSEYITGTASAHSLTADLALDGHYRVEGTLTIEDGVTFTISDGALDLPSGTAIELGVGSSLVIGNGVEVTTYGGSLSVDESAAFTIGENASLTFGNDFIIYVYDSGAMTVGRGTTIVFGENGGLEITGTGSLAATGADGLPVTFTGAQHTPGYWNGLYFYSDRLANRLDYCVVEYGGGYEYSGCMCANVIIDSAGSADTIRLILTNTTLQNSGAWGLFSQAETLFGDFGCNTFTGNSGPAFVYPPVVRFFDNASTYSGNDSDRVYIQGDYSGIETDATWPAIDAEYLIDGLLWVDGGKLSIQAGATLAFMQDGTLEVLSDTGVLAADGTAAAPITFTGVEKTRGYWRGLYFYSDSVENKLNHCVVEYGGGYEYSGCMCANVIIDSAGSADTIRLILTNTTLQNSGAWGLFSHAETVFGTFENNALTANPGPAFVYPPVVRFFDNTSTFLGNDSDRVLIQGDYSGIETNATWSAIDAEYLIDGLLWVDGGTLTLRPGVTLVFLEGASFEVSNDTGILIADGSASKKITFTGSTQQKGWWYGIYFNNAESSSNLLNYCVIEYGGRVGLYTSGYEANIIFDSSGFPMRCDVTNCDIQHSDNHGIWVASEHTGTISGNNFTDIDLDNIHNE